MSVGLMSHILHPLKGLKPLTLEQPLAGLMLISPWVSFESGSKSYVRNKSKDIHGAHSMHEWAGDYVLKSERNNWSEPIRANSLWWRSLPAKKTLNIWGEYELFQDDIAKFGETLVKAGVEVTNLECPKQVHVDCMLDAQTDLEIGPMSTEIWKWLEMVI